MPNRRALLAAALVLSVAFATACSNQPRSELSFFPGTDSLELQHREQKLTIERNGARLDMIGLLEFNRLGTNLAVLNTQGLALFSVTLTDGASEVTRHPDLPTSVDIAQILRDVQLVNWPKTMLERSLPSGVRLEESATSRRIYRASKLLASATFDPAVREFNRAELSNHAYDYQLSVQAL